MASRWCWLAETAVRIGLVVLGWRFGPVPLIAALALPPLPWTPAARRCRRRPHRNHRGPGAAPNQKAGRA